jgi:2-polyprenyl-3-methyl-5-hydroxy-6-metoxy-1,4-benzoquinol methylase
MTTPPPCCFCGSDRWLPVFAGHGFDDASERFDTVQCAGCGLARTDPVLDPDQLGAYYAPTYYGSFQAKFNGIVERMVHMAAAGRARSVMRGLGARTDGPIRVLDIGCGRGVFLRQLHRLGAECYGSEISTFALPEDSDGICFLKGRVEDLDLPDDHFDVVSLWHVLEHTTDPAATLAEVSRIVRPGGLAIIAVPNFGSLQRRLFGKHWFHLDLPRHTHHFSHAVLQDMLRASGFIPEVVATHSGEQNLYGFVQSALNATFPTRTPNALYMWLKAGRRTKIPVLDVALAGPYLAAAVVENAVSVATRQGATAIVFARKAGKAAEPAQAMAERARRR